MNAGKSILDSCLKTARPTIGDIAKLAGVSIATVSHVVNNTGAVGEATRQKVRLLIEGLGYEPNIHARSLASERNRKTKLAT